MHISDFRSSLRSGISIKMKGSIWVFCIVIEATLLPLFLIAAIIEFKQSLKVFDKMGKIFIILTPIILLSISTVNN